MTDLLNALRALGALVDADPSVVSADWSRGMGHLHMSEPIPAPAVPYNDGLWRHWTGAIHIIGPSPSAIRCPRCVELERWAAYVQPDSLCGWCREDQRCPVCDALDEPHAFHCDHNVNPPSPNPPPGSGEEASPAALRESGGGGSAGGAS